MQIVIEKKKMTTRLNILLAEDDESNQLLIEKILSKEGHSITVVNDGQEALDELDKMSYDICILDMQMPVLAGIDTLKMYKKNNPQSNLYFIILSGDESSKTVESCLNAGANIYLKKPVHRPTLINVIHSVCGDEHEPVIKTELKFTGDNIDISKLTNFNDQKFLDEFIDIFEVSVDDLLNKLLLSLESDFDIFKKTAHSIKGLSGNIAATKLRELSSQAENINRDDYLKSSKYYYEKISEELYNVRDELVKHSSDHV